ncbi:hypothetical protein E4U17_004918 [Claviceps sp. LM77 group G4]|nr:hypothetical protein E4U17_004918 [Claviceps sp. LM77 group G4]KAG6068365.1 hypothetical protein E4U33_005087 [Claviceps sp. LM78 group G4]KAG6072481.1 hypothetical protein E4U16_005300 [Claviceps sp. LM84 group G4]
MPSSPLAASPNEAKQPVSTPRAQSSVSSRFWKWKTRCSLRSNGDAGGSDLFQASPTAPKSSPLYNFQTPNTPNVASPYLSESAHVLSLQNPVSNIESRPLGKGGDVAPKSKKDAIKTGEYTRLIKTGIGALPTIQPNSRSVHTRTANKEVGLKDPSSKETGARYIERDIGSNDTSLQYVCEDIGSKDTGSKCIVSTDMVSGDLDPKDKNFKETGTNCIVDQDAAPKHSVLSTVNEGFLISAGIGSQIHSEHGKKDAVAYGSAVQFSEDLDVGCGPARTNPLGLSWPNGFLKKASRLKPQKQRSKSVRKLLPLPRFQTKARRSSGGTNGPTLPNTPHGTNRLATLRLNTAQSANTLGGGARQYASNGRGHSRRQAKGFLLVNDASGKHAGQSFPQHTSFTAYTHQTESSVSAKQCFFPAT